MCGIVGYVGDRDCSEILLSGLQRLEYRGYDSAGIAIGTADGSVKMRRAEGKLSSLFRAFHEDPFDGCIGLGHTRWATHGRPSERNAHPHKAGRVIVAHNGIIENYAELKKKLAKEGREFKSETDTEVIAHLIDHALQKGTESLHQAVGSALKVVDGSYALVVMEADKPEELVVARNASPMVIGTEGDQVFAASDVPAVLPYTREFIYLEDGDTAVLKKGSVEVFDASGEPAERESKRINWDPVSAEKQGYKHFMLKEIHEQPARITDALRGRVSVDRGDVDFGEMGFDEEWIKGLDKIVFVACGTSYYAAQVAKYTIEELARVPVEVDLASEFRYRNPLITENTLCIPVSQSGETADTLAAMRQASELGAKCLAICNVIESTIAREAEGVVYTQAGPEIGVASTKAFTTQLAVVSMLAVWLGRRRGTLDAEEAREILQALRDVPGTMDKMLHEKAIYKHIAYNYSDVNSCLYLGRGNLYPIACEGALKLKEISYIHAEGYAAGEMKHGPIALIDENLPVVILVPKNRVYEKVFSNLEEVKARQGQLIALATEGDNGVRDFADVVLEIPDVPEYIQPLLSVVVMQLLAYHVADFKGTDVDQPRNLAKSVTVE
ncbi:glutamine--fructose-6-phosphate transaminase (isomerizing) [Persicimonas caeni]|uniref:Glutamine--fructose-6-phosphate aminotransferase [isomerizing] n=1 Tax=Persicimonas caeni TaxID=2292766 RepID=A0A4Y6PV86_PERCE|nr:glutamine--fructose-6-phosphate transaminase (isomerizing) [Persicimonas caeni]QDG52029.1 glutamine--fructose-6-phosphate transaminase (isomerizing) [Persicimonas caeni]QED33250.1 glutamine--fructose-6-phosphate transaminase (isomerizing) [Persicimonas caeni]